MRTIGLKVTITSNGKLLVDTPVDIPVGQYNAVLVIEDQPITVNLSEVIAKLAEAGINEKVIQQILSNLNLEVVAFDQEQALQSGMLRPKTKSIGLSLFIISPVSIMTM